jgi:hypothetical protein
MAWNTQDIGILRHVPQLRRCATRKRRCANDRSDTANSAL